MENKVLRQTVAQKLNNFRWATKMTASTVVAGSALKWAVERQKSSRIPESALQDAAEMLKPSDSFDKQLDTKNIQSASNKHSHD